VYHEITLRKQLELVDQTSPYALTGAIFLSGSLCGREWATAKAKKCRQAIFYINDKPTGAVVFGQPFGGARASGTNDKAGSMIIA